MTRQAFLGRVSDIDIRLLRVFRAVVACGGVSAAELELNIGRSTISRHLKALELRLAIRLCDRGPAGFALSADGERVYEASSHLLAAINAFQADVDDVHRRLTGHMAIAVFSNFVANPEAKLSQALRLFDRIAPRVTLEVHVEPTNIVESGVLDGRFYLGIVPSHRTSSSLDYLPLYRDQMYLYCGKDHSLFGKDDKQISQREIRQCKFAGLGYNSPNMVVSHQLRLKRDADAYDEEALAALVLSGRYLGFLPNHLAEIFVEKSMMRPLRPDIYHYQSNFAAIVRHSPKPSRLVERFLDCLRQAHGGSDRAV